MTETLARCSNLDDIRSCCSLVLVGQVSHVPEFANSVLFLLLVREGWLESEVSYEDLLARIRGV